MIHFNSDAIAILYKDHSYTYKDLNAKINFYDETIRNKIPRGSVVGLVSDYTFESISLFFALYNNKIIIVPITDNEDEKINAKITSANCDYKVSFNDGDLSIEALNPSEEKPELIKELQRLDKSGLILFSSGSTGKPKLMIHNLNNLVESYKTTKSRKLVFLVFLMFDHIGGLNTLLNILTSGGTMVVPEKRDAEHIAQLIEKHKINILPSSPTFLNLLLIDGLHKKYNFSSLKLITYGTEPMPESLLKKLNAELPNVKLLQTFGTSETGIIKTVSKSSESLYIKFDDENQEYKIENGELWIKSKLKILGYINNENSGAFSEDWFKTGDIVEEDADGYLKIIGRKNEVINVGGEKVLPAEIESALLELDYVKDCIVYGENNPITGQSVSAKIILKNNEMENVKDLIKKDLSFKLQKYKIPRRITIVDALNISNRFKKNRL